MFAVGYDQAAGTVVWSKCYGGTDDDWACAIAHDFSGDHYVVGASVSNAMTFDTVTIVNAGQADGFIAKMSAVPLSVLEMAAPLIAVFPNPCTEAITISFPECGDWQMILCDMAGREIIRSSTTQTQTTILLSSLVTPGCYVLAVFRNGARYASVQLIKY